MLKYNINLKDIKVTEEKLNIFASNYDENEGKLYFSCKNHGLHNGDTISLRNKSRGVNYQLSLICNVIDNDNFYCVYNYIGAIDDYSYEKSYWCYDIDDTYIQSLVLNLNKPHYYQKNRSGITDNFEVYTKPTDINVVKQCVRSKNYIYADGLDYITNKMNINDEYIVENADNININDAIMFFNLNETTHYFINGVVPMLNNGNDDIYRIIFNLNDNINSYLLFENEFVTSKPILYYYDYRFLKNENNVILLDDMTDVYVVKNSYNITLLSENEFSGDLTREEDVFSYFNNQSVNKIIDYEKQQFSPVIIMDKDYVDGDIPIDNTLKEIEQLRFNLYFREKDENWENIDDKYWNNYAMKNGIIQKVNDDGFGDLYGDLGFTDNEVYNQMKRFGKSFIRLSFYDSPNRNNQNLLFYTTIFIDTRREYNKLIKNISTNKNIASEYVSNFNDNDDLCLACNFSVKSNMGLQNSSDGFYLYLFPDIIEGNKITHIYMKVEFNNAKYGKKVPFVRPLQKDGTPLKPYENGFPLHYTEKDDEDRMYVNMIALLNDMYTKFYVKYDFEKKRYVWFLAKGFDDGDVRNNTLTFDFYEPRVNVISSAEL